MPTATAEKETKRTKAAKPKQTKHGLSAKDIIEVRRFYPAERLEYMLGIPYDVVADACRNRCFSNQRGALRQGELELLGADVLAWIDAKNIEHAVTDEYASIYWRTHPKPESEPAPPKNLADQALDVLRMEDAQNAEPVEEYFDEYVTLLGRFDKPAEDDQHALAAMMRCLEISPDEVKRDAAIVARLPGLRKLHEEREVAHRGYVKAREALHELKDLHRSQLNEAEMRVHRAERHMGVCAGAAFKAHELTRKRPQLFAADRSGFPRLRSSATALCNGLAQET